MKRLFITFVIALLTACAQLGVSTPQTFNEKAYVAAMTVDEIQKNTTMLLQARKISASDAESVAKATEVALQGVTVARTYAATSPAMASSRLDAAVAGLTALTTYLAAQGAK